MIETKMKNERKKKPEHDFKEILKDQVYDTSGMPTLTVCYAPLLKRVLFYPTNSLAMALSILMKKKAFSKSDICAFREIGFTVDIALKQFELPEGL